MTGKCFVVAFGHGQVSAQLVSPQEASERLRNLVDTACKAKGSRFTRNTRVSVAPGGVMFALRDDELSRTLELCQAVAAQLEHQARTHTTLLPVCAAITYGHLRQVDVLGFSSNFEGWPAIAAARVVAKLAPGECAIEQSVWQFSSVLRDCSAAQPVEGKAHDKPFQIRIHQRIKFPVTSHAQTLLMPPVPPQEPPPPQLTPYEEFTRTVRQRLHDILQRSHMQVVREALTGQGSGVAAEDILAPAQPDALLAAMDHLYHAAQQCLPHLRQQPPNVQQCMRHGLRELLGWQALLIMNREQLQAQQLAFDPNQQNLRKDIPLHLEAGIEVLVSSLGERAADFVLKVDNQQRSRVVGRTAFLADELEHGLTHTDQLTGVLQRIWGEVRKPEPPPPAFGTDEIGLLRARLQTNERRDKSCYYIAVPRASAHALTVDRVLLERLHAVLPTLRLMYLISSDSAGILLIDEYLFNEAIETFLRLLADQEDNAGATP
jgi:hypothetical protein